MKPITTEEIEYASGILFTGDSTKFYDDVENKTGERVDAIRCLESKTIVACPGSGKTTVLLAKLIILARRMPFDDGKAICVLTHTNVAIDLIKEKLGAEASKLFAYPNFFGTIQNFVDRFLACPFTSSKSENRNRPHIDNELYFNQIDSYKKYLGNKTRRFCIVNQKKGYPYSITWDNLNVDDENFCKALQLDLNNADHKIIYEKLKKMKCDINGNGIFCFNDAFFVAEKYIIAIPNIKDAFQERFKFVFIDEMQDTATHQSNIINKLFKESDKSIIQEFGDPNQAIFDYDGQSGEWNYDEKNCLHLNDSKRFGESIARIINPLKIKFEDPVIQGVNPESILPPYLIVFDETQPDYAKMVLDEFGKLIIDNDLHHGKRSKYVAIGRVGKDKGVDNITLKTYLTEFEKNSVKAKDFYPTLIEYFQKELSQKKFNYSERIINSILHLLELHDFKNEVESRSILIYRKFTKTTLFDFLQKENEDLFIEFKTFISDCGQIIKNDDAWANTIVHKNVTDFVKDKLLPLKAIEYKVFEDFVKISDEISENKAKPPRSNIYTYKDEAGNSIPIKINTIHGEKGETHTATLFLETYKHRSYDSLLIKPQLAGKSIDRSSNHTACKMAYVAMSRPERLLCFAVSSSRISREFYYEKLKTLGWEIRIVNSEVTPAVIE